MSVQNVESEVKGRSTKYVHLIREFGLTIWGLSSMLHGV